MSVPVNLKLWQDGPDCAPPQANAGPILPEMLGKNAPVIFLLFAEDDTESPPPGAIALPELALVAAPWISGGEETLSAIRVVFSRRFEQSLIAQAQQQGKTVASLREELTAEIKSGIWTQMVEAQTLAFLEGREVGEVFEELLFQDALGMDEMP